MAKRRHARTSARNGRARLANRTLYRRPLRLEPLEDRRLLAVVTVNTDQDIVDFNDGLTSLREAIFATNLVAGADTINFDFGHDGPATILLTQGELPISDHLTITGPGAALLTIDASGNDPTPDANNGDGSRVFRIDDGAAGTSTNNFITGLTVTGGDTSQQGGAIYARENLTVREVTIAGNASSLGGGIAAMSSTGSLTVIDSTISGNVARGFRGNGGGIHAVTNRGGEITIQGTTIADNRAALGGGIFASVALEGRLAVRDSHVINNLAQGVASPLAEGSGGGLQVHAASSSSVVIENANISGNIGGGLHVFASSNSRVMIEAAIISGNTASLNTSGVNAYVNTGSSFQIARSTISNNETSEPGGGIRLRLDNDGEALVSSTTISDNRARSGGGASVTLMRGGSATFEQVTVSGNTVTEVGGGIQFTGEAAGGRATLRHSTIFGNVARSGAVSAAGVGLELFVEHTIVAGSGAPSGATPDILRAPSVDLNVRHSLIRDNALSGLVEAPINTPDANGNIIGGPVHGVIDPLLGPLADNGGPTLTHALLAGSPAINRGDLNALAGEDGVPQFDQRGEPFGRVVGGRIDIGAFEFQEPSDLNLLVDTLVDEQDGDFSRGDLSLREAIALANALPVADTIAFHPDLTAAGPATILLTQGELPIVHTVTINGPGATLLTIDAEQRSRIFNITATEIQVTIAGLTLTGGRTTGNNPPGIPREFSGGAIRSLSNQALTLFDTHLIGNSTTGFNGRGGAIFALGPVTLTESLVNENTASGAGSAIHAGSVTLNHSTVSGNDATISPRAGASAITAYADVTLHDTIVSDNPGIGVSGRHITLDHSAISGSESEGIRAQGFVLLVDSSVSGNGGTGISSRGSSISLLRSNVSSNGIGIVSQFAAEVILTDSSVTDHETSNSFTAGIHTGGDVILNNSTVANNRALSLRARGAGIFARGNVTLNQSTVSGNTSGGSGGGIYSTRNITLNYSTVTNNAAAQVGGGIYSRFGEPTITITGSIVAGNTAGNGMPDISPGPATLVVHHSLVGNNDGTALAEGPVESPDAHGNIIGGPMHGVIDPLLGPLADNGGPTQTHALLAGSPAINRGDLNAVAGEDGVPLFDQRGEPFDRVVGGRIDIGAFEYQTASDLNLLVDTLVDEMDGDHGRGDLSLREAITLTNAAASDDTIRFDPLLAGGTILLTQGELKIIGHVAIIGLGAELLTIDASGSDLTPDLNEGNGSRIFSISGNLRQDLPGVRIGGLTLTGGDVNVIGGGAILNNSKLRLEGVVITGNHALGDGGGIANPKGTLTVVDSTISGNRARRGGAVSSSGGDTAIDYSRLAENTATERGGALFFFRTSADGDLSVTDSTLTHNTVLNDNGRGGAVYAADFPPSMPTGINALTITGNIITENTTRGDGAGIYARMIRGSAEISNNVIERNTASNPSSRGGGILLELVESTSKLTSNGLRENSAGHGGGVFISSPTAASMPSTLLIDESSIALNTATGGESQGGAIAISGSNITTTVRDSTIDGNRAAGSFGRGGGIYVTGGPLTIEASTILRNNAGGSGGGVFAASALRVIDSRFVGNVAQQGGGIDSRSERQLLEISGTEFDSNSATGEMGNGGAIHHQGGQLTVTASSFGENSASGSGGVIYATGSLQATITESLFIGNSAALDGGAVASFVFAGRATSLSVHATRFANNHAGRNGGGLLVSGRNVVVSSSLFQNNEAGQNGGAIGVQGGPFTLSNSTLSNNLAHNFGGGMWTTPGVTVAHSTIYQNEARQAGGGVFVASGTFNLSNSIVAGNIAIPNGPDLSGFLGATINPRFSLIGTNIGSGLPPSPGVPDANGNMIGIGTGIDPRLGPLTDNGGLTLTQALLPDSPAINAGDPSAQAGVDAVPAYDQRGEPFIRVFGGRIDIGAFERLPAGFLPGDYDRNGVVDSADYVIWRNHLGMAVDPGTGADGNGDGIIDERDYAVWKSNFMSTLADLQPMSETSFSVFPVDAAAEESDTVRMLLEPRSSSVAARVVAVGSRRAADVSPTNTARRDDALVAWLSAAAIDDDRHAPIVLGRSRDSSQRDDFQEPSEGHARIADRVFTTIGASQRTRWSR